MRPFFIRSRCKVDGMSAGKTMPVELQKSHRPFKSTLVTEVTVVASRRYKMNILNYK